MGLDGSHRVALALLVAAQGLALAQACPWLDPAWTTTLALAASVATLPVVRARHVWTALAASLALTIVAFCVLGTVVGALVGATWWGRADGGAWALTRLLAAAVWWWALHAPVVAMRWRTQAMLSDDAAREVVASMGSALLATMGLLVTTSAAPLWATAVCLALAVGTLKWSWRGSSPEGSAGDPPTHAGEGSGAPFRAVRSPTPERKLWWRQWALFAAMVGWGGALMHQGAWRFPHAGQRGRWDSVVTALQAVRVGDDPCGVGPGEEGRREFTWNTGEHESLTLWASGAVAWGRGGGDCGGSVTGRCIPVATARGVLARASDARAAGYAEVARLARTPWERRPLACGGGRWVSISPAHDETNGGHCGNRRLSCELRLNGELHRSDGYGDGIQTGLIPATNARSLIEAVEAAALARGPLVMHPWTGDDASTSTSDLLPPVLVVGVGPGDVRYRVDFPQAPVIDALFGQRLCNALPNQEDVSPAALVQLSDDR